MTEKTEISDQELLERIGKWIAERRLTAPAIIFLESHRPLNFVGSQAMVAASPIVHFLEPFFQGLVGTGYEHRLFKQFSELLEKRETIELLIIEIERANQDFRARLKEEKKRRRELKQRMKRERKELRRAARGKQPPPEVLG